jgi:hypothetical protein
MQPQIVKMKDHTSLIVIALLTTALGCSKRSPEADDKNTVLPGRHMSEHQVVDIASRALPQGMPIRCEFKDSVWQIFEVQKNVWGISSATTNADGKVFITSTNPTRIVLRVHDTDGQFEQVKKP